MSDDIQIDTDDLERRMKGAMDSLRQEFASLRTGRASDSLPTQRQDLEAIARWAGYGPNSARELEEDYLRATRRARTVYEKLFYGHLD